MKLFSPLNNHLYFMDTDFNEFLRSLVSFYRDHILCDFDNPYFQGYLGAKVTFKGKSTFKVTIKQNSFNDVVFDFQPVSFRSDKKNK